MSDKVLLLRTCNSDMTSYEDFVWPESGPVEAPDWRDDGECGHGLHGLLWGEGDGHHLLPYENAKWLVVEVERSDIRGIGGKYKFSRGEVILCGSREEAVECIQRAAPDAAVCFGTTTAGRGGTAITGDSGTSIAGDDGTATTGSWGTSIAGDDGTATAGYRGTAIAGDRGVATIVGYGGTAIVGEHGVATAGDDGILISDYYVEGLLARQVAKVGQEGILPNTPYRCVQSEWEVVEV